MGLSDYLTGYLVVMVMVLYMEFCGVAKHKAVHIWSNESIQDASLATRKVMLVPLRLLR